MFIAAALVTWGGFFSGKLSLNYKLRFLYIDVGLFLLPKISDRKHHRIWRPPALAPSWAKFVFNQHSMNQIMRESVHFWFHPALCWKHSKGSLFGRCDLYSNCFGMIGTNYIIQAVHLRATPRALDQACLSSKDFEIGNNLIVHDKRMKLKTLPTRNGSKTQFI